jgi:hypothetical protein
MTRYLFRMKVTVLSIWGALSDERSVLSLDTTLRAQAVFIHCSSRPAVCTPTQVLANQRPQLQLRLQLARTQPSGNWIKMLASNRLALVSVPSSLAAPLSARVRHGSSPTCEGSNSRHRRPSTLPAYASRTTQHAATLRTVGRRHCRARTGRCQPTLRRTAPKEDRQPVRRSHRYPCKFLPASPARNHRAATKEDAATKRPLSGLQHPAPKSGPFQGHIAGILQ